MTPYFFTKFFFTGFFVFGLLSFLVAIFFEDRYPKGHPIRETAFTAFVIFFTLGSISVPLSIICGIWGW